MKRWLAPVLCLCFMLAMSVTAFANTGELIDVSDGVGGGSSEPATDPTTPTEPPTEPLAEGKYIITIAPPKGWHTKSAVATVALEDVNGTSFQNAEARIGNNGAWQDISDALRSYGQAGVELSDNGTLYVAVTDMTGKAHVKSLYIECFDRESPVVKARAEGRSLRAEADDALSGVESIYVNGERYDDLTNDTIDVRISEISDEDEEEIFVYAVDLAGNRSKTVSVKNPEYEPTESSKLDKTEPTEPPPIIVQVEVPTSPPTQPPAATAPTTPPAPPPASKPEPTEPSEPTEPVTEPATDPGSVTPSDGTGTVTENSVKMPDQREFFSITTDAGNDFYIVVDKQRDSDNVYLLNAVTEDDLAGLAEPSDSEPPTMPPLPEPVTEPEPEPTEPPTEPTPEPESSGDTGTYILIILLALAFGGGVYYFKIIRPKKEAVYTDDEDEDMELEEEPNYPDDEIYYPDDYDPDLRQQGEEGGEPDA